MLPLHFSNTSPYLQTVLLRTAPRSLPPAKTLTSIDAARGCPIFAPHSFCEPPTASRFVSLHCATRPACRHAALVIETLMKCIFSAVNKAALIACNCRGAVAGRSADVTLTPWWHPLRAAGSAKDQHARCAYPLCIVPSMQSSCTPLTARCPFIISPCLFAACTRHVICIVIIIRIPV